MNILITGTTGFIGSNLVNTFKNDNTVYNLGRNENATCKNIYWNLKSSIEKICLPSNIDTIIHCASIVGEGRCSKREYIEVNVISTLELLEYSKNNGVKQFVYISTGGVYGFGKVPFREEDQCNPCGVYNISKHFSEKLCIEYSDKLTLTILRPFFPYGKGQNGRLVSNLINQIRNGEEVTLNNDGMPLINPIHIGDLCNITKGVVDKRLEGILNVCGNEIVSIKDLCMIICGKVNIENVHFNFNGKSIENMLGDNKKIQNALNYHINTTIFEGIEK